VWEGLKSRNLIEYDETVDCYALTDLGLAVKKVLEEE
jgi:hypothetical protein